MAAKAWHIARNPLLPAAILFAAGIAVGASGRVATAAALACAWAFWLPGAWLIYRSNRARRINDPPRSGVRTGALANIFLAAGIVAGGAAFWTLSAGRVDARNVGLFAQTAKARPIVFTARMRVATSPQHMLKPRNEALASFAGAPTAFTARVISVKGPGGRWQPADGAARVSVIGSHTHIHHNMLIRVDGFLGRPSGPRNPGAFNEKTWLRDDRIFATVRVPHANQVRVLSARPSLFPLGGWISAWQHMVRNRLYKSLRGADSAHVLGALLLGRRDARTRRVARAFAACGAAHLLAISGLHVLFVAALLWWLLPIVVRDPRRRCLACIVCLTAYMALTPCGPAVLRAGIAVDIAFLTMAIGLPTAPANILGIAAIAVLLWSPGQLFGAGFQLTFVVTGALLLLAPRVKAALFEKSLIRHEAISRAKGTRLAAAGARLRGWLYNALTFNLVATLAAFPLVAWHFHTVNPLSVVFTIILLPVVLAVLALAALQAVAAIAFIPAAHALAAISLGAANIMIHLVTALAAVPGANVTVRRPPVWCVLAIYAVVMVWIWRRSWRVSRAGVATLGVLAITCWSAAAMATQADTGRVWVPALGTGDAALLQSPDGATLLVNAGSVGAPNAVEQTIKQLLDHAGIGRLDACVATRLTAEHASALLNVASRFGDSRLYIDGGDMPGRRPTWSQRHFFGMARRRQVRIGTLFAGQRLTVGGDMVCRVLWPPRNVGRALPPRIRGLILLVTVGRPRVRSRTGPPRGPGHRVLLLDKTAPLRRALAMYRHALRCRTAIFFGRGKITAATGRCLERMGVRRVVLGGRSARLPAENGALMRRIGVAFTRPNTSGCARWRLGR